MSTADRNYTDVKQSGIDSKAERIGDITGEPPTKEEIKDHLNTRSPSMGNRINDVVEAIENNLDDDREYGSTYDVETAAGLVKKISENEKPYARDSGLNKANRERVRESERQDPYNSSRERIESASSRDVSPNTPTGEDI